MQAVQLRDRNRVALMLFMASAITAAPLAARAGTDLSKFPLMQPVPSDVFIAITGKANHEREFLDKYWAEVAKAFHKSGVIQDISDMITDAIPEDQAEEVEDLMDQFTALIKDVEWGELFSKEMLYAGRFRVENMGHGSPYDGILIGRMTSEKAKSNQKALRAILSHFADLVMKSEADEEKIRVQDEDVGGVKMSTLQVMASPEGQSMSIVGVGYEGDLLYISLFGNRLLADYLALRDGKAPARSDDDKTARPSGPLVQMPRFKAAFDMLPPAEDLMVFFDTDNMLKSISGMLKFGKSVSGDDRDANQVLSLVIGLLKDVSIVDYSATVEWTDGYRVFSDSVLTLKDGAADKPFAKPFTHVKPITDFARFIPKEAESFSSSCGINWVQLYDYALDFIKDRMPEGETYLEDWKAMQESWEFNLENDLLGLLAGPMGSYSKGKDWAVFLKVTDEKKMMRQVKRLFNKINDAMGEGGKFLLTEVSPAGHEGFLQISHPMMMMFGGGISPPVIGCAEGHLFLGSSDRALATSLKTAAGKHENISTSDRFKEEGLKPKSGEVNAIHFTDESNMAQELQGVVGMLGMYTGMVGMFAQDAPPQVKSFISGLAPIFGKLVPVVGKMDFFQSSAGCTSFDGKKWTTHNVQNYKNPSYKDKEPSDDEDPSATESKTDEKDESRSDAAPKHKKDSDD